jgi:hypothetical protein
VFPDGSARRFWMAYVRPTSGLRLELRFRTEVPDVRSAEWLPELGERLAAVPCLHSSAAELIEQPSLSGGFLVCTGALKEFTRALDWVADQILAGQ